MIEKIKITPNYPNQLVNFFANNQNFTIELRWIGYEGLNDEAQEYINMYNTPTLYCSIICNNTPIVANIPVINRTPINQYPSPMNGYIVAVGEPTLENLGVTCLFYYVDVLSELEKII